MFCLAIVPLFRCWSGTIHRDSDFFRFRKYTKKAKFTKTKIFGGFVFLDFFGIKKKDSEYAVYNSEYATHKSVYAIEKSVRGTHRIVYATHGFVHGV